MQKQIVLATVIALTLVGCSSSGSVFESNAHFHARETARNRVKEPAACGKENDQTGAEKVKSYRAPVMIAANQPMYPAEAQARRKQGSVRVQFDVTPDGRVDNVEILCATPPGVFEKETLAAVRKWEYEKGRPGNGLIVNINFRLNGGAKQDK